MVLKQVKINQKRFEGSIGRSVEQNIYYEYQIKQKIYEPI